MPCLYFGYDWSDVIKIAAIRFLIKIATDVVSKYVLYLSHIISRLISQMGLRDGNIKMGFSEGNIKMGLTGLGSQNVTRKT
jgi:hypothetical protein